MPDPQTIVIVEDDAFLRRLYELKFTEQGFRVEVAEDGEAGLALIRSAKPAVVLLDIELPKLDGFGVLRELKADEATRAIPVLMLTNSSTQEAIDQARSLGAADYIIKAHFLPSEVVAKALACLKGA
ncbi:MAG: response regulator [Candidatus Veblenbacteria bacterium]|nr:response regulator [Candidatus Veblenbacteria bacterium]